jgi:antitoxin FitA
MATLIVRNLDDALVRQLRIRAAEHGRSAEAEHREILRIALTNTLTVRRQDAADRLAAFRKRTAGRGGPAASDLLPEAREARLRSLAGHDT